MYLKLININYAYTQFTIPEQSTKRFNEPTPKYTCAMRFAWKSYSNIHILCLWIILKEILAGQESRMLLDNVKAREREKRDMLSAIGLFLFHRDRLPRFRFIMVSLIPQGCIQDLIFFKVWSRKSVDSSDWS